MTLCRKRQTVLQDICLVLLMLCPLWVLSEGRTFTVGFMTPAAGMAAPKLGSYWPFMENSAAAISLAVEDFQQQGGLQAHTVRIVWRNDRCVASTGVMALVDLREHEDIDVIIGPLCSFVCVPAGYYLTYWNIPFLPHSCTGYELADKTIYKTLIRVNAALGKMGKAVVNVFQKYNWKKTVMIGLDFGACVLYLDAVTNSLKLADIDITENIRIQDAGSNKIRILSDDVITLYLGRIKERGRIVVLCLEVEDKARFMYLAHKAGMTTTDYVYITFNLLPDFSADLKPWMNTPDVTPLEKLQMRDAYHVMKQITMANLAGPKIDAFLRNVTYRMQDPPWNNTYLLDSGKQPSLFSLFLYDATYLYLTLLNETLAEGGDPRDGHRFFLKTQNRTFQGVTGSVVMDDNGDREPDYWVWHLDQEDTEMKPFMTIKMTLPKEQRTDIFLEPYWGAPGAGVPPDEPKCGFLNELCASVNASQTTAIAVSVTIVLVALIGVSLVVTIYRKRKTEEEINKMIWKVDYAMIKKAGNARNMMGMSMRSVMTRSTGSASASLSSLTEDQHHLHSELGIYKGLMVTLNCINIPHIDLTRQDLYELKMMREMSHENLCAFVGACVDPPNICILMQYCPKGSLMDIIGQDEISLDNLFKQSLISDLTNGMAYIHGSALQSHGSLKSTNCLVDSRWVLKITSYGCHAFKVNEKREESEYAKYRELLWTAPELLKQTEPLPRYGTQKADVYSYAIILQEIIYRAMPFFLDKSPEEIILQVRAKSGIPLRPSCPAMSDEDMSKFKHYLSLMTCCWSENPDDRPTFEFIKRKLKEIHKGKSINIMDTMIQKLEKYANNLEDIVAQRTTELVEEKKKTDSLLYRMLPQVIAEQLKQGKTVAPELYDEVTIYFSDIVGFTSLSSESTPMQVVDLLNDLYTLFDDIIADYDVYKVETIGDAYMCVSGLPQRNGDRHAAEIANMALDLLSAVFTRFRVRHRPGLQLRLRIGIHTGPCAAGVVGLTMPRYCLFGDTVNMASRMESNGLPLRIHISTKAYEALQTFQSYKVAERGFMEIKGKGQQKTYWIIGRDGFEKDLPSFED